MKAEKVYLVGFMAAGKTTLARALARRLDWRALDIDEIVEQRERLPVADIFAKHGEAYFRIAERDALADQLGVRHVIVATGGGTFVDPQNRSLINADGLSVWLDIRILFETVRIVLSGHRPVEAELPEPQETVEAHRESA